MRWGIGIVTGLTAGRLDPAAAAPKPSEVIVIHGRTPFQRYNPVSIPLGSSQSNPCPTTIFTVPSGKILVIDYMTVLGLSDAPTAGMFVSITTVAGGISVDYLYALAPAGQNVVGDSMFATTASTQLYADGGSAVGACVSRGSTAGSAGANISISGHLIDQ